MNKEFRGIPVSPGVCIGRAFLLDDTRRRITKRHVREEDVDAERQRIRDAIQASLDELEALRAVAQEQLGPDAAGIFAFHKGMLCDGTITEPMLARVQQEQVTAEYAVQKQFRIVADMFAQMADSTFQTKVDDVWDLDHRVLKHLIGEHQSGIKDLEQPAILVAPDLTPSQAASLSRDKILGFVTDSGGQTSHTAIFARALGIPAVVGVGSLAETADEGDLLILDGERGVVMLEPDEQTIQRYRDFQQRDERVLISLAELKDLPAETTDGVRINLTANIEFGHEAATAVEQGGDGVGLFRTEFLWLTSDHEPTEDEQFEQYKAAVEGAGGANVTLRTFDLGADKYTQQRALVPERNPFLGLRSIRYCFENQVMFKRQLRAILRASAFGPTSVMFPLIANLRELRRARMMLNDVIEDLQEEGVPHDPEIRVGMMVEVPAAAVTASSFAREVDFFSIGTNDLVQYTLAVDRTNERVADLYASTHPAVIRLIKDIIRAARRRDVPTSVCGEVAGQLDYALLLIGLGLRSLSVTPSRIPYLKRAIRSVDIPLCERLARTAGSFDSERQVTDYLREKARRLFPELLESRGD